MSDERHKSMRFLWRRKEDDAPEEVTLAKENNTLEELSGGAISEDMVKAKSLNAQVLERGFAGGLVERPHMDALLSTGYLVIYKQLQKLLEKSLREEELSATETKQLDSYLKLVRTLGMEERDQRAADELSKLSDDELKAIALGQEKSND